MFRFNRKKLRRLSRDRDFLIRAAVGIIAASVIVALILWFAVGQRQNWYEDRVEIAQSGPEQMLDAVREAGGIVAQRSFGEISGKNPREWPFEFGDGDFGFKPSYTKELSILETVEIWLKDVDFEPETLETLRHYAGARFGSNGAERRTARTALKTAAEGDSGRIFVHECLGDLEFRERQREAASTHYRTELERRESSHARSRIVEIALLDGDKPGLRQLLAQPEFRNATPVLTRFEAYARLRDFWGIFGTVLVHDYARLTAAYVGLTLFVALVWFFIVGQFSGFRPGQLLLYLAAILLGAFSASLTLFAVIVQENVFALFPETDVFTQGLINCVAGIGLREEFIKLACFVPLLPILLRRANPMEALIVAGFVGLGFAVQENLSYYARSGGEASVARFLTANFLHLALTGLVGFAAYLFARAPQRNWEEFVGTFLLVVLAHGIYDALLIVPELGEYSWLSIVIFALLAYRFFNVANALPFTWRQEISPLGIFVIGTSLLVGVSLNVVCFGRHPYPGYLFFLFACIQLIPTAFVFVNTFRSS